MDQVNSTTATTASQNHLHLIIKSVPNYAPLVSIFSIFFFITLKSFLIYVPVKIYNQGLVTVWKWKNLSNSLVHSTITGIGALICFYMYPDTAEDPVYSYSTLSLVLAAFTTGYFIYDFFDMLLNHRKRSSYELMVHHVCVCSCFSICTLSRHYLGFGMAALLVEVNSIFLHWRQLLLLSKSDKSKIYFRAISLLNLLTFVVFRIVTLGWLTRWLILNHEKVPTIVYHMGCISLSCVMIMSTVLFFRLLRADHFQSPFHKEELKTQ